MMVSYLGQYLETVNTQLTFVSPDAPVQFVLQPKATDYHPCPWDLVSLSLLAICNFKYPMGFCYKI
jgi:hypothetical protein